MARHAGAGRLAEPTDAVGLAVIGTGGTLLVVGIAAPGPVPEKIAGFDLPLAATAALAAMVFAYTGGKLSRREGGLLLAACLLYLGFTAGLI